MFYYAWTLRQACWPQVVRTGATYRFSCWDGRLSGTGKSKRQGFVRWQMLDILGTPHLQDQLLRCMVGCHRHSLFSISGSDPGPAAIIIRASGLAQLIQNMPDGQMDFQRVGVEVGRWAVCWPLRCRGVPVGGECNRGLSCPVGVTCWASLRTHGVHVHGPAGDLAWPSIARTHANQHVPDGKT